MIAAEERKDPYPWIVAAAYLLLLSPYLLYWNHAEYFVDDWFLMRHFRSAVQAGATGVAQFAAAAAENRVYGVFRTQWLSILYGFFVTWLGDYSPRFNFALLLALHGACAWLLSQAMWRFGAARGLAFAAGALYLLAPTTHFGLFTYLTSPFFVLSTFWVLVLAWRVARAGPGGGGAWSAAILAVPALFSGEQAFLLLWAAPLVATLLLIKDARRKRAFAHIAAIWGALGAAAIAYLLWINRVPVHQEGFHRRYEWTWAQLKANMLILTGEMSQLSGVRPRSAFHISAETSAIVLAIAAALLVAAPVWMWRDDDSAARRLGRVWLFALAGVLLAYAPVLFISGGYSRLRYHYVPTPFLALGAAALCWTIGRAAVLRALLCGAWAAYFALNATTDIRQCWIPQSDQHRLLVRAVRDLHGVSPGDILIISGTPYVIGTAQHFTMHSSVSAKPFAEWATGVAPLEVGLGINRLHDRLVLYQRDYERRLDFADLARTHVLAESPDGRFSTCDWVAQEAEDGRFRLLALKGARAPAATLSREQLALVADRVYFARAAF
jgi:hypothetical protein